MNLLIDHNPGAYAVRIQCLRCYSMLRLADAITDRDGPAFKAYYHQACAAAVFGTANVVNIPIHKEAS